MELQRYSQEFMKSAVVKMMNRGNRPLSSVQEELGVSLGSLYRWKAVFGTIGGMKKSQSPQDRSSKEKLKSFVEFSSLPPEKQGEYLRKEGLHFENIEGWRKQLESALDPVQSRQVIRSERAADRKKIKALEKELHRKDKALAETTALLVLKKKANLIWGTGEDE
jgi:transposase